MKEKMKDFFHGKIQEKKIAIFRNPLEGREALSGGTIVKIIRTWEKEFWENRETRMRKNLRKNSKDKVTCTVL